MNDLLPRPKLEYRDTLFFHHYETPIGMMIGCFSNQGLCVLDFHDRLRLENSLLKLQKKLKSNFKITFQHELALRLEKELNEYFSGQRSAFTVPLHLIGSDAQLSAWKILQSIPAGEVWTYQQQAIKYRDAKAARAMGMLNSQNPISLIVPCHRVIGANGQLTGYGGGLPRKEFLLNLVRKNL